MKESDSISQTELHYFPVVETASGKLKGMNFGGIHCFRGIPYGATTAGNARFMPPRSVAPWTGVREAFGFGQIAPQRPADMNAEYQQLMQWDIQSGGMGEDCLHLNVWTPGLNDGRKRPVFVSIHGGNWDHASSNTPVYHGDPLARYADAVVVTVNHRLGSFGFLHLADIAGEPFAHSGNAAMLDLVAALQWVKANAAAFGGDPGNVLVFGESGGGRKVSALLAMPQATGLFHRAIVQSGSVTSLLTRDQATENARRVLDELGIAPERAASLQDVPMLALISAQIRILGRPGSLTFLPVFDGDVFPRQLTSPQAALPSADVPVIMGTTRDESSMGMTDYDLSESGLKDYAGKYFGARAEEVLATFRKAYPDVTPHMLKARIDTHWDRRTRVLRQAEQRSAAVRAPVWVYRFDAPSPANQGRYGAVHAMDISLPFHNTLASLTSEPPAYLLKVMEQMSALWLNFARTGNPNGKAIPDWQPYNKETRITLVIDKETRAESDPDRELRLMREAVGDVGLRSEHQSFHGTPEGRSWKQD